MEEPKLLRLIEHQYTKKSTYLKQEVFKDEIFIADIRSIGDLDKKAEKDLDPMKNIPNSIRKRIEAKNKTNFPNNIKDKIDIAHSNNKKKYVWKRIGEVKKGFDLLRVQPNAPSDQLISDVIQGNLGNCYFLSAISAFSEQSVKILNLFPEHYDTKTKTFKMNSNGLYEVQVYINGKPMRVIVDDFFPCLPVNSEEDKNNNSEGVEKYDLAFSIVDEKSKNIWPLILEKAWSKVNGSYANIIKGNIMQAFYFISPSPVLIHNNALFFPDKQDLFHRILNEADDKNNIICADISEHVSTQIKILTTAMGLLHNHAYSVISIVELDKGNGDIEKLLKIRNPWGSLEWNGDWSDISQLWNDDLKKKAGYTEADDGFFFMNFHDYLKFFTTTYVCTHQITSVYTFQKIKNDEKNSFFYFLFDIKKQIDGYFVINFKSKKIRQHLKNDPDFENYYYSLFLFKQTPIGRNQFEYTLLHSNISNEERKDIGINEDPGKFILMVKLNNFDEQRNQKDFIFSMENFVFEKSDKKVNFKIGLYANVNENDYTIQTIDNKNIDVNLIKRIFSNSVEKIIKTLPKETYTAFFDENQKDTFRILHFEKENTGLGLFTYNNESNATIMEKITINNIQNICFVPILDEEIKQNIEKIDIKSKSTKYLEIEENIFDDENENDYLKHIKESEKFESGVELITPIKNPRAVNFDKNKEVFYQIKPNSKFYGLLFKNSENTDFDISSRICFKYPLSQIWQEKPFETKKTKLKFKDTYIPIIETIVKYNNGILVKYKNKTNDFIAEVKIKMQNARNIKANKDNFSFIEKMYGAEAEGIIKINDDGSCMMVVNPEEMAFVEFSAVDLFEEVSYDINFSYNIYTV
jgi:hypothetical protein